MKIKIETMTGEAVSTVSSVKAGFAAIENFSCCSMDDSESRIFVSKWLKDSGYAVVKNCFGVRFTLEVV